MGRRRRARKWGWGRRLALGLAAVPGLYLIGALGGGLASVNRGWVEPAEGVTVYLADNGVHTDLVFPVRAAGLDWAGIVPPGDMAARPAEPRWIALGAGERHIYLDTPTWADLSARNALRALIGGERVMHVEYVASPDYAVRAIRLRPAEYRRLWAAVRASFRLAPSGRAIRLGHPGYGPADAFYAAVGKANAIDTCNQWTASRLRLAGVKAPVWSPFVQGLVWRYRAAP